jgi:hypothetical protein
MSSKLALLMPWRNLSRGVGDCANLKSASTLMVLMVHRQGAQSLPLYHIYMHTQQMSFLYEILQVWHYLALPMQLPHEGIEFAMQRQAFG